MSKRSIPYIGPKLDTLELIVETAILAVSDGNLENPMTGNEIDW